MNRKVVEFDPKLRLLANGTPIIRKSAELGAQKPWEGKRQRRFVRFPRCGKLRWAGAG